MLKNKQYIILFTGYSIHNTPKIKNLIYSLQQNNYEVLLFGIVKDLSHDLKGVNLSNLYSKGNQQGFFKIVIVCYYVLRLIFSLVFKQKNMNIYAINPISGLIAYFTCIFSSNKYVYESHEMIFGLNYPFFRGRWRYFWRFIEKIIILKSEYFFSTDKYRLSFTRRYYNLKNNNMGYILNTPLKGLIKNSKLENRKKYNFGNKFVLSYCGGIIKGRGIESIIESFAIFKKNNSCNALLLLAGSIDKDYQIKLEMLISKFGIVKKEFIFTGKLKSSILAEYMSASDATFALYNNTSLNNRMCSPNKIFEAIHCKTFLITTNSFLTSEVVLENNIGVIVNDINAMNIYYAINSCLSKKISSVRIIFGKF